jgi:hypothetical protein
MDTCDRPRELGIWLAGPISFFYPIHSPTVAAWREVGSVERKIKAPGGDPGALCV